MESRTAIVISLHAGTSPHTTVLCLQEVAAQARVANCQLILVCASFDALQIPLPQAKLVTCIDLPTTGWKRGADAANAACEILVLIDSAYVPSPGWLQALLGMMADQPEVAIAGSLILTAQGNIHTAGLAVNYGMGPPLTLSCVLAQSPQPAALNDLNCRAVPCSGMAIRARVFRHLGGFDSSYKRRGADVDLCLRAARDGHRVALAPRAQLVTLLPARYELEAHEQDELTFLGRWLSATDQFDSDIRHKLKGSAPRALSATRPSMSVINVILPGAFFTLGTWLEITRATLGPNDDWLIVDASAHAGSALYGEWMARHTMNTTFIDATNASYTDAVLLAVARAKAELVALPAPNAAPSWHWLERGAAHLLKATSNVATNLIAASLPMLGTSAPVEQALDLNVMQRALLVPLAGRDALTAQPETLCFVARKSHLVGQSTAQRQGWEPTGSVHTALDVWSTQLSTNARPATELHLMAKRQDYAAANLAFEDAHTKPQSKETQAAAVHKSFGKAPFTDLVSIVVPVLNQPGLTAAFLESMYTNTHRPFELILVDNGSVPAVRQLAASYATTYGNLVYIRNDHNQGFGFGCNQGLASARGGAVVVINNDVLVPAGWLSRMLAVLQADVTVGMVGPATNRCVGEQQIFPPSYVNAENHARAAAGRTATHRGNVRLVNRLVGLCLLIPRSVLEKVGGFDPAFGYGNFEDDDLGLRVRRAGFALAIADDVLLHHEGSATFVSEGFDARALAQQNWEIFCLKWHHDPGQTNFAAIEALAYQSPFSPRSDFIPLQFAEQFSRQGHALPLDTNKPLKMLFTPDVNAHDWWHPLRTYLATFGPDDPVALVLRPEPATPERVQRALNEATALLNDIATAKGVPVVLLEATHLPPQERASLYRAVHAWLDTTGPLSPFVSREASAVGLTTLSPSAEAMRDFVAKNRGSLS